jgi:hypothetical protein
METVVQAIARREPNRRAGLVRATDHSETDMLCKRPRTIESPAIKNA